VQGYDLHLSLNIEFALTKLHERSMSQSVHCIRLMLSSTFLTW